MSPTPLSGSGVQTRSRLVVIVVVVVVVVATAVVVAAAATDVVVLNGPCEPWREEPLIFFLPSHSMAASARGATTSTTVHAPATALMTPTERVNDATARSVAAPITRSTLGPPPSLLSSLGQHRTAKKSPQKLAAAYTLSEYAVEQKTEPGLTQKSVTDPKA